MTETAAQNDLDPTPTPKARVEPRSLVASALALGALALPDHTRMSRGQRHLLRLARSAYVGWYTADMARRTPLPDVPPVAFGAVAGVAATLVTAPVDEAADRWLAGRLESWGVRRPRLTMAVAGAGLGALLALDNQRLGRPDAEPDWHEPSDLYETVEVPADARALVEALLDAVSSPGADRVDLAGLVGSAATLRGQLEQAQAQQLQDWPMSTDVHFEVPTEAPRVVPQTQGWPVRGHFEAGELPLLLELWIAGGHLSHLSIMLRDDDLAEDDERWETDILEVLEAWPTPDEVRLVVETAEGTRPLT